MVEAYGFEPDAVAPAGTLAEAIDAVREARRTNAATKREWLAHVADAVVPLDAAFLRTSLLHGPDDVAMHRLDEAFTSIRCVLARAGAAHILQRTWGLAASGSWRPSAAVERISTLLDGTIFPGLGLIAVSGLRVSVGAGCWPVHPVLIQQLPGRLTRRGLAKGLRHVDVLLDCDPGGRQADTLRAIRGTAVRLLEMRFVTKAMQRAGVRGLPRRQAKKAVRRQAGRLAATVAGLEWQEDQEN
jgi:hypothetical protein